MPFFPASPRARCVAAVCALALAPPLAPAQSQDDAPAMPLRVGGAGKLLLTGGVSSIDGAAGGGLTPWGLTAGYADRHELGATAFASRSRTQDYALNVYGVALGWNDTLELSLARQEFDAGVVVPGTTLHLTVAGAKWHVAGDAVLDSDTWMPQVALGLECKLLDPGAAVGGVLDSVAAKRDGVDLYANATKLFLAPGALVNATVRATKANQNGLLGFGSADSRHYSIEPEVSIAKLLRRDLAIGAEYRAKPDKLAFAGAPFREDDWKDVFVAWAPNKHVSLTLAWVDLGNVVGHAHQQGGYVSLQVAP